MQLDETILISVQFYPGISPTRENVLNHLFFTIGNGYEWVDGELICDEDRFVGVDPIEHQAEWASNFCGQQGWGEDDFRRMMGEALPIIETAEERASTKWYPHEFDLLGLGDVDEPVSYNSSFIYPICRYSRIHSIPDDVKDDWLLGAVEAINMVFHLAPLGVTVNIYPQTPEERARQLERNLEQVKKAKANLIERFGSRLEELGAEWLG